MTTYIQFETPKSEKQTSGLLEKTFVGILSRFLPKANPDFEDKIDAVKRWLVEIECENGMPKREIGLDNEGRTIVKMPFKNNRGFWTDSNITFNDLKNFSIVSLNRYKK